MNMTPTHSVTRIAVTPRQSMVYGNDDVHRAFAAERLEDAAMTWPADTVTIGIETDGALRAVVLFNLFMGKGCHAHIATDGARAWASRGALTLLFAYPFLQCDLHRVTLPIARRNIRSQVLALKLGFSFEGRLTDAWSGDDEILMGMTRPECPWLPPHGE